MNYEEAFRHYKEGTATEEEKEFVQNELARARALSTLFDDHGMNVTPPPIKEADKEEVKAAKKNLLWKKVLVGLLGVVVLLVVLAAALGGVFGAAAKYARDAIAVTRGDARLIAEEYAYQYAVNYGRQPFEGENNFIAEYERDIDEKFMFENNIRDSYYVYRIDVTGYDAVNGTEWEFEIEVNTVTGVPAVHELDIEYGRPYRAF